MASIARAAIVRQTATSSLLAGVRRQSPNALGNSIVRQAVLKRGVPISAFHTTTRRDILPPGPQVLQGGVNDAVPIPPRSPSHGSYHWIFERALAAGLVPLTLAPFASGSVSPYLDAALCAGILIHSHAGFQQIIIDYIPKLQHPFARKLFWWGLNLGTIVVGIGLYEFETTDVGLTEAIKRVWKA